jgi:hypothetical protein
MNLDELIEALNDLKQLGREIGKEPIVFVDKYHIDHKITSVREIRRGNFVGKIELR